MMEKSTTETRRHGGKLEQACAAPGFDNASTLSRRCQSKSISDHYEPNFLFSVFSVPPCLRGGFSASAKEQPRP